MSVRARMTWGMDAYLETLVQAGKDIDRVVTDVMKETAPVAGGLLYHFLRRTSESWTGATARTIFVSDVQQDGNFIYFVMGAHVDQDPAGLYKEFGRPNQAAEPFFRPTLAHLRRTQLRQMMKLTLERMGLPT